MTLSDCNICGGDGYVSEPVRDNRSTGMTTRCPGCDGTGRIDREAHAIRRAHPRAAGLGAAELTANQRRLMQTAADPAQHPEARAAAAEALGGEPLDEWRRRNA